MRSLLKTHFTLRRLFFVLQAIGDAFLLFPQFCSVVRRFVSGHGEEDTSGDEKFASEARSLIYLQNQCQSGSESVSQSGCHLAFVEGFKKTFDYFHGYTVECGIRVGSVLVSKR